MELKLQKRPSIYILNKIGKFIGKGFRTRDVQLSKENILLGMKKKEQKENKLIRKSTVTHTGLMTKETTGVSLC